MSYSNVCEREIVSLHDFFVDWYTGRVNEGALERLEAALGPDFEMVTPDGHRRERGTVIDGIRSRYDCYGRGEFDIEIRNVETRSTGADYALVRYEECQEIPAERTVRLSTVLFEANSAAPDGVVWWDLHETWLEPPESGGPATASE